MPHSQAAVLLALGLPPSTPLTHAIIVIESGAAEPKTELLLILVSTNAVCHAAKAERQLPPLQHPPDGLHELCYHLIPSAHNMYPLIHSIAQGAAEVKETRSAAEVGQGLC